jgi:hypothetical protein
VGLQVAVHKNGEFLGTLYTGGLPGDGWEYTPVERSSAKLNEGKLDFTFAQASAHVDFSSATIKSSPQSTGYKLKKLLRQSPTLGLTPPQDAVVLFAPGKANKLLKPEMTNKGLLKEGTETTEAYDDFRIHVEFSVPYHPDDDDQKRGNSGIYIQSRYEIQILDSFGEDPRFNSIGALYRQKPADLNMSLPPLNWQTYDIWFEAAKFDDAGKKTAPARVSVFLNGVPVHYNREIVTKTGAGKPEGPLALTTKFQDHQDPVRFRSIWIQPGKQPLPPNKILVAGKVNNHQSPNFSSESKMTQDCEICNQYENDGQNHYYSAYPYAYPENYTKHEPYGTYGKLWPFTD